MTIGDALTFIDRGFSDSGLRKRLNAAASACAREKVLAEENLSFTVHDFDEAYHHRLTQCQEEEDADQLKEFRMWWALLSQTDGPDGCARPCAGCGE